MRKGAVVVERLIVLSGGQTGSDAGALRAAAAAGVRTGGHAPKGFLTEDGPAPWLGRLFGLIELGTPAYRERTLVNVRNADAVLWYGHPGSPGGKLTLGEAFRRKLPECVADPARLPVAFVAEWLGGLLHRGGGGEGGVFSLLVAGNRESKAPGIGVAVEKHLGEVLAALKEAR